MWVLLEAEDVLLFRDSRPFTAGEDFRAEGLFPPLPPPIAGAIRYALLSPKLQEHRLTFRDLAGHPDLKVVREKLGTADTLGALHLAGPLACTYAPGEYHPTPWFALPADALGDRLPRLREDLPPPGKRKTLPGGLGMGHMAVLWDRSGEDAGTPGEDEQVWLDAEAMQDYLRGEAKVKRCVLPVQGETRTGIRRSATGAVETGHLYSAQMHRPEWKREQAVGLLVRADLPPDYLPPAQFVPLGGEGRRAFLRPLDDQAFSWDSPETRTQIAEKIAEDEGRFRLYLATPGIFAQGLIPSCFPGALVGIASGKPVLVGGWDLAANAPRPLRRAAPAGTVYFGKLHENTREAAEHLLDEFHWRTALQSRDTLTEAQYRAQMGFGLTLVGAWTQNEQKNDGNGEAATDAGVAEPGSECA